MAQHFFAYGTLIVPSVMQAVCGTSYQFTAASLDGYTRFALKGKSYPAIVKDADSMVDGILYLDIDNEALKRLDYFEGKEYQRVVVQPALESGKKVEAFTYLLSPAHAALLTNQPWNLKKFKDSELDQYLKNARQAMRDFR